MCHHREKRDKATVRTIGKHSAKKLQVFSTMRLSEPGSRGKARITSGTNRTVLAVGFAVTFLLLTLVPACHGASASTDEEEGRSLLSFSPSALKKRLGGGLRPTGRSYFDAEDILLFMLGLGLASMLGLATFMAPFTSILATGLTPVTVQGNVAPAAATAAVTHGRRRRRSSSWTDGTYAAELLHAMEEAHEQYKKPL